MDLNNPRSCPGCFEKDGILYVFGGGHPSVEKLNEMGKFEILDVKVPECFNDQCGITCFPLFKYDQLK